ncbi:MAG: MarR family transcriptional regulator, partial [Alphaproteobacteria bacterium HGW-Alphaproteobacteria-2]
KTRGYYQGSNVSYNLKKLVGAGYMHHQRCAADRRAVRVRLTARGREVCRVVEALFARHASQFPGQTALAPGALGEANAALRRLERYWSEQIRYIY